MKPDIKPALNLPSVAPADAASPAMLAPTPKPEAEPENSKMLVVKAARDFTVSINGSLRKFKAGEIEGNHHIAEYLLNSKCPVTEVGEPEQKHCPNCKHIF